MIGKILIINPFGVGDVLFSTPLVSLIKKIYPGCYIGYICNIRTKDIIETNPEVSELFVFERDEYRALWKSSKVSCIKKFFNFWHEIKRRKFDVVIDLSLGKEYAFLCWLAGIKERLGFNYKGRGWFLTHKIAFNGFNDKPVSEYYLDIIRLRFDASQIDRPQTVLFPSPKDEEYIGNFLKESGVKEEDILVGIAPGGGISFGAKEQERRRWGVKEFAGLVDRIVKKFNVKVVLIWGLEEEPLVRKIAESMTERALIAPNTRIREMAALCKRCKIVICSEGGPLHIASSQGIKTISIFGPVDEKVYGPYPPSENNVVISSDVDCRPCYKRFKLSECNTRKCLERISIDKVFDAVCKLM
ncbi:MAG: glycosyltransferase family 9 protein [Candidatus Omnitrophica bacterium]|nr:glycosyltransferase family 9 protein [Candidatus Omnitrophota bacterium]